MSWETLTAAQQDALLRRPFDHFARYRLAAEIVAATAGPEARVLDLGGGPGSLQAFLPQARVTATDLFMPSGWHEQAPDLVLADGAALPFADDAFDIVVSLDTLEHVKPDSRPAFLHEVCRVAAGWGFVVCPYATSGVADADTALRAYVASRFAPDLPTIAILDEHLGYGHPDLLASREILAAHGPVAAIPSGRLDRWFAGMITFFHLLAIGEDEPVEVTQRFLNRNFYEADLSGPSYRHGLLVRTAVEGP
ncbi:MAG TPA: class I SAM-dependent methyltransferase, partial [Euzebya sp.]|nr:class I SAM-dependent methyltransferase [Euzebya sp.]